MTNVTYVSNDNYTGTTYVKLNAPYSVATTRNVSTADEPEVLVDLDLYGEPVGVEFLTPLQDVTAGMVQDLAAVYPHIAEDVAVALLRGAGTVRA